MSSSNLSITRERFVSLGDKLWHSEAEPAKDCNGAFSFGERRICADIEALFLPSEQRLPTPQKLRPPKKQEGKSTRVDPVLDAQWRTILQMKGEL